MADARITVDDILGLQFPGDAQLHPTRPLVAFVVSSGVAEVRESQGAARVWIVPSDGSGAARPLSADHLRATHPRWSPTGAHLAYLGHDRTLEPGKIGSAEQDTAQLFVLDEGWGEARKLTHCAGGVIGFAWSPDGATLTLMIVDAPPANAAQRLASGADQIEYERCHRFTRLWTLDPSSGDMEPLSTADAHVFEFAWSPDGRRLAALIADEPYNWAWYGARLALLNPASGGFTTLHQSRKQYTAPAWSPDSSQLAVIQCTWSDQGMSGGDVLVVDTSGAPDRILTTGHSRSYLNARWDMSSDSRLCCAAIEDGEAEIGWLTLDGTFHCVWRAPAAILHQGDVTSLDASTQQIAFTLATPRQPPEIHTLDLSAPAPTPESLTNLNPALSDRDLPETTVLHWRSFDGQLIQGLLVRPAGSGKTALPTVVQVHGGPTSLWQPGFMALRSTGWISLLAAAGYAVLLPNPRGSMGFGTAFAEANIGDMGGADWADVMAGIEHCIAEGFSDPTRLALAGWSYGGYLTAWGITQTQRFKAAVAGASITNWISFHGVSTIPGFDATFYPGGPFNWDGPYAQFSPMLHVRNVTTPTLFLHGERDPICPLGQAHEMWRALKERGVETQLVVYPREGHGIREREHARDVLERAVTWIVERV